MTFSHINRRTATVLTAAIALGTAGPAVAQPIGASGPVPVAPPQLTHDRANVRAPFEGTEGIARGIANAPAPSPDRHMRGFAEMTGPASTAASRPVAPAHPKSSVPGSDLVYVLIGGVVVALGGLGGTLAAANRRRTSTARARIAG